MACGQFVGRLKKESDSVAFLCKGCDRILMSHKLKRFVPGYASKTLSLCAWNDQNDQLVRKLVMALKGGGSDAVFLNLATRLVSKRLEQGPERLKSLLSFVPAPRHPGAKKRDHAEELAFQLAKITGGEYLPVLKRASHDQQKRLNERQRRQSMRLALDERRDFIERLHVAQKTRCIIFVDDVVTSGSTASSAFDVLGAPKLFEVWTIFFRPRLRVAR